MTPLRAPGHGRSDLSLTAALMPRKQPSLALIACRWRWEIAIVGAVSAGVVATIALAGTRWLLTAAAALAVVVAVAFVNHDARRTAVALAWCVITPHRVRTCFAEAWICNRAGRLPAVLRATGMPSGERVKIWCPAGIGFDDICSACELLAAACWADEVTACRSDRFAHVVYVDVVRRPPAPEPLSSDPGHAPRTQRQHDPGSC